MPRLTLKQLMDENAELNRQLQELRQVYHSMVEDLQGVCHDFGCLGGENRIGWLRERLSELRSCLIDNIDLYWGAKWRTITKDEGYTAYHKLDRAREAIRNSERHNTVNG